MCGVAGIFAYHYAARGVDVDELLRIREHMHARGPDDAGHWVSDDGRVGLAHRRLSIIDPAPRAAQPMASADGQLVVSFNGEIYNYRALREQLRESGVELRTESDTEVLLHLYERHGERMFEHLRGMYAFALWDARLGGMLLARDPYGIKPLYYANDGWTCRMASQVSALRAGGRVSSQRDPAGEVGFLLYGSVPEPYTLLQEVRAVPAGSFVWVGETGPLEARAHFDLTSTFLATAGGDDDAMAARDALVDSVRHHMVADVEVGAFLSGGVDSAAVVSLASRFSDAPVRAVTLEFEEFRGEALDEGPLAQLSARALGARHERHVATRDELAKDLPRILGAMDQPSVDGINTWLVSKAAASVGLKVALSGIGGDELFGGYPSFRDAPELNRGLAVASRVPGASRVIRVALSNGRAQKVGLHPKAPGVLDYASTPAGAYFLRRGLFLPWELSELLGQERAMEGLRRFDALKQARALLEPPLDGPYARTALLEAGIYLRNQLLRDTDWASMAHSLEVRTPLVDATLLSVLAPRLARGGSPGDKSWLVGACDPPIPASVVGRAKTGFATPIARWIESAEPLQAYRRVPSLAHERCPWARRLAYSLLTEHFA